MNKTVEKLFTLGQHQAIQENNARLMRERDQELLWMSLWRKALDTAKERFPEPELAQFVMISDERYFDHQEPPRDFNQIDFSLEIEEFAPIKVIFDHPYGDSSGAEKVDISYKVPRIEMDEEENKLIFCWSMRGCGYRGSGSQWMVELPRALYEARVVFATRNLYQNQLDEKKLIKPEPVYSNMDGSEPVPDLVLVAELKKLIREIVSQANVG